MKRLIIFLSVLWNISFNLYGQNGNSLKTLLEGDGYTYVHELTHGGFWVNLYNQENKLTYVDLVYKETGELPPFDLREKCVEDEAWSYDKAMSIINNAFSLDQKLSLSEQLMLVAIYINSTTGKIMEVRFGFREKGPFSKIPLSVFREIEVKLKEEVYFTLTEAGRKVNYVFFAWNHEVK